MLIGGLKDETDLETKMKVQGILNSLSGAKSYTTNPTKPTTKVVLINQLCVNPTQLLVSNSAR